MTQKNLLNCKGSRNLYIISSILPSSPNSPSLPHLKFSSHHSQSFQVFFFMNKVSSHNFFTPLHDLFGKLGCESWGIWDILCLVWIHDLFMFIWLELRENWKLDQRNKKESKIGEVESSWTRFCLVVFGFDVYRFVFFSYFYQKLDFLKSDFSFWFT